MWTNSRPTKVIYASKSIRWPSNDTETPSFENNHMVFFYLYYTKCIVKLRGSGDLHFMD